MLRVAPGDVAGIDHGLTFHTETKLRTVLWGWAGTPIDPPLVEDLVRLAEDWRAVGEDLEPLLTRAEIAAAGQRLEQLLRNGEYPGPDGAWPALPWPAM